MLKIIGEMHSDWVRMAVNLGSHPSLAEDVIQECYLRLHKYKETVEPKIILEDGSVNIFYMFGVIRNTLRTSKSKEANYLPFAEFFYEEAQEEVDEAYEIKYQKLMDEIQKEVDSWGAYNSKLFNLYFKTDLSMRKIAKGSDISLTHIFTSLSKFKETIKEKFENDFNNLKE